MTVRELLQKLDGIQVAKDALVAYGDFLSRPRMTTYEYIHNGRPAKGIVLWNAGLVTDRLKTFDGLLTVECLVASLRDVAPDTELLCSLSGYLDPTPRVINSVKVFEKVCKGQVRKQVLHLEILKRDDRARRLVLKPSYKVVYNRYANHYLGAFTQELIGYAPTLQEAADMIRMNLETLDQGDPSRQVTRSLYGFDVIECMRPE